MLTAQASGVQPVGRGQLQHTIFGQLPQFPSPLTVSTLSISGLFFCNKLFRPPSYPKNQGNPRYLNPNKLLRALSHQSWLSPQSPCSEEGKVSAPKSSTKAGTVGFPIEPAPFSAVTFFFFFFPQQYSTQSSSQKNGEHGGSLSSRHYFSTLSLLPNFLLCNLGQVFISI